MLLAAWVAAAGCNGGGPGPGDAGLINGCPSLEEPLASPGDPIDGDDWEGFAQGFFESYCTRCHHSSLPEGEARSFSPVGLDFDQPAIVRESAADIRNLVGVFNAMPPDEPMPSCEERRRIVRWIDADTPGI